MSTHYNGSLQRFPGWVACRTRDNERVSPRWADTTCTGCKTRLLDLRVGTTHIADDTGVIEAVSHRTVQLRTPAGSTLAITYAELDSAWSRR